MASPSQVSGISKQSALSYKLRYWGSFGLIDQLGRDHSPRSKKARAIIVYIAAHIPFPVQRERLAALLWSDRAEEQARASLRQSLYELRHLSQGPSPLMHVSRGEVRFDPERIKSFDGQLSELVDPPDLARLAAALSGCDGIFFPQLNEVSAGFDDWLTTERTRYRTMMIEQMVPALQSGLSSKNLPLAREIVNILETIDPLDESIVRIGMQIDAEARDMAALERRYQRHVATLATDLGVEPSADTENWHGQLLSQLQGKPRKTWARATTPSYVSIRNIMTMMRMQGTVLPSAVANARGRRLAIAAVIIVALLGGGSSVSHIL